MNPFLAESFEKFGRAEHHAADLTKQIGEWVASRAQIPLPFTGEFEDQQSRFVYRVGDLTRALPSDWPLIIGDALANYRAALDYLAWRLVEIRPDHQPLKRENLIQFPLIWEWRGHKAGHDRFIAELPNRLPGVDSSYVRIIEDHQPYKWARHDASERRHSVHDYYASHIGRVERHPLALLDQLSNHDKHRQLQVVEELGVHVSAEVVDQIDCDDVVGIGLTETVGGVALSLLSLERYREGHIALFRLRRARGRLELDFPSPRLDLAVMPEATIPYRVWMNGGTGSGGMGEVEYRQSYAIVPAPPNDASETVIEVRAISWERYGAGAYKVVSVDTGPWRFTIRR